MKPLEIYISHPKPDSAMGNTGISVKTSTFLMIGLGFLVLVDVLIQTAAASEPEQIQIEYDRPNRAPLLLIVTTKLQESRIPKWEQILSGAAVC